MGKRKISNIFLPTEVEIDKALLKALRHYEGNLNSFPKTAKISTREIWFLINCSAMKCSLCALKKYLRFGCKQCPINDDGYCCIEWQQASAESFLERKHIVAIYQRIEHVCFYRGLIKEKKIF